MYDLYYSPYYRFTMAALNDDVLVAAFTYRKLYNEQFARIHTRSLIKMEKILNTPITKFCNSDDVNGIVADLRLTKMRSTSFYKRHNLL